MSSGTMFVKYVIMSHLLIWSFLKAHVTLPGVMAAENSAFFPPSVL